MTQEEKLEEAKRLYKTANADQKYVLESLFPELKESEGERMMRVLIGGLKSYVDMYSEWYDGVSTSEIIAWLEKQGEQKPADKVEPKFHEGEWVVYECGEETATLQITRIVGETYVFSDDSTLSVVDEDALRLWDITKDAKDGDVLSYRYGQWIFIYKGIVTEDTFKYHALLSEKGITVNDAAFSLLLSCITPATKEQRDLLFQKMHEAGYEWDAEKKELKKVEFNPDDLIEESYESKRSTRENLS